MDAREFGTLVKVLRASYPANNILDDKDEWKIWYMKLQNISYEVAAKVIDEMISGLSAFPPTLPQIMSKCNEKMHPGIPTANEAWRLIEDAASKYGIYHWEQALENVPEVIMNAAKGQLYRDICLSEDREAVRRHFISIYKENVSQLQESQLLGLADGSNDGSMGLLPPIKHDTAPDNEDGIKDGDRLPEGQMKCGMTVERLNELKRKHGLI
ncbi:MAG: replicative helicase loader/inhibitor [Dorea sp.]|nr:replicative helicase loader/inhibitor [Dorea sp.]